jgi:lipopolysaccharide biosynthesis regulator YciM
MNLENAVPWLKSNWYVPLLIVGVAAALMFGKSASAPEESSSPGSATTGTGDQNALRDEFARAKAEAAAREATLPEAKSTDTVIAEHTAKLEQNPEPEEAAALLSALGNLHKQKKQDYAAAARYYEQIIEKYPEWSGIRGVYHQLMTCYSNLDDQGSLRLLYRKMVEVFPEESNEYQFAKDALGE